MKLARNILLIVIVILIILRLMLPGYLLKYVVNQINKIPEYKVQIDHLDVHLIRGAYTIRGIKLWKITKKIPVPFYSADAMDFSIEWKALLGGKLAAKIVTQKPKINFVTNPNGNDEQLTISKQWIDIVKSLYPLDINRLEAHKGEVAFISFKGNPPFKLYVTNVEFLIENMQTSGRELLSSSFSFDGDAIGGGSVIVQGRYDPFNKQPTFHLKSELRSLKVINIANFLKHYTLVDVQGGVFSLYSEAAAANGKIKGYAKPFIKNLKIGSQKNKINPVSAVVNTAAAIVATVLENPKQKTIATKINFSGNVDDPNTSILSIIGYLLQHAFIQALLPQIDNTIQMQDVLYGKETPNKPSKPFPTFRN